MFALCRLRARRQQPAVCHPRVDLTGPHITSASVDRVSKGEEMRR